MNAELGQFPNYSQHGSQHFRFRGLVVSYFLYAHTPTPEGKLKDIII
jgi:hypothetical protein